MAANLWATAALALSAPVAGVQLTRSLGDQCAPLQNNFVSFTVNLCVGTPPQCFDVVADTGSNLVIVPSCLCQEDPFAGCRRGESCFTGTNKSSTFHIEDKPQLSEISFGSGSIQGTLGTDVVSVGPVQKEMDDGVFLMTNRAGLKIDKFEGILGMGVPTAKNDGEKMFFEEAGIDRFSLCVGDGSDGALRFGMPPFEHPVRQIGTFHWGVDLRGMSVGPKGSDAKHDDIIFCGSEMMSTGMDSPCGAIPDSGTTLIIGPKRQVEMLEESICKEWPRCKEQMKDGLDGGSAYNALLMKCGDWMEDSNLYEMPSLFWHVRGADGQESIFELTAWAYVTEFGEGSGRMCQSMIGHGADLEGGDYITEKNGPIWIVGTPLFYEYRVGFDMQQKSVALEKGNCVECASSKTQLLFGSGELQRSGKPRRGGHPRRPHYNVSVPL